MNVDILLLRYMNNIIAEAIEHGGDSGGAYYSNRDGLIMEMSNLLRWAGFNKEYGIMDEGGILRFYKKEHIVE
jgi:hypothetical protein